MNESKIPKRSLRVVLANWSQIDYLYIEQVVYKLGSKWYRLFYSPWAFKLHPRMNKDVIFSFCVTFCLFIWFFHNICVFSTVNTDFVARYKSDTSVIALTIWVRLGFGMIQTIPAETSCLWRSLSIAHVRWFWIRVLFFF